MKRPGPISPRLIPVESFVPSALIFSAIVDRGVFVSENANEGRTAGRRPVHDPITLSNVIKRRGTRAALCSATLSSRRADIINNRHYQRLIDRFNRAHRWETSYACSPFQSLMNTTGGARRCLLHARSIDFQLSNR